MTKQVNEILSWYPTLTNAQKKNLTKILNFGRLGGTGKMVILPVDQGFEHGPGRSFEPNPAAYDPRYHAELAIKGGCNAYAAPLGALEAADDVIKKHNLPTILKASNHDIMLPDDKDPLQYYTSWVDDAVRLDCAGIGLTLYQGSTLAGGSYELARQLISQAREAGLIVVIWTYPRGSGLPSEEAETAIDVISYAVQIAALLGATIIKCKTPKDLVALPSYIKTGTYKDTPTATLADRIKIVQKAAFNGRRLVIHSGGSHKDAGDLLEDIEQLKLGGADGSIVGRNAFQRPEKQAIELLQSIQDIYLK